MNNGSHVPHPWRLAPEGAAVHVERKLAVVADLHLGYEWARGRGGDQIPAHSLNEVITRLARLFDRFPIETLVVAGDLVESPRYCPSTERDLRGLGAYIRSRGATIVALQGNHDPRGRSAPKHLEIEGWTIAHGHEPIAAERAVTGHDHPVFKAGGTTARCILAGPTAIVLPAFSENAAGLDVASDPPPRRWTGRGLRCWVEVGGDLLDFGPIDDLAQRMKETRESASARSHA